MIGNLLQRSATSYRFLTGFASQEDFDMNHIMLDYRLRIIVLSAVEYQITWLHFMELKVDRASINLIALITRAELEAKFFLQILDDSADETTAVKEYWCFIERIVLLAVSLGIRHS